MQNSTNDAEIGAFIAAQRGSLERMVSGIVRGREDVQDAVQAGIANFLRARERVSPEGRAGYLKQCVRREALRFRRSGQRVECIAPEDLTERTDVLHIQAAVDPEAQALSGVLADTVAEVRNCFPALGAVNILTAAGHSSKEAANVLGITVDTVNVRNLRFRRKLLAIMAARNIYTGV